MLEETCENFDRQRLCRSFILPAITQLVEKVIASDTHFKYNNNQDHRAKKLLEIAEELLCLLQNDDTVGVLYASLKQYGENPLGEILMEFSLNKLVETGITEYGSVDITEESLFIHSALEGLSSHTDDNFLSFHLTPDHILSRMYHIAAISTNLSSQMWTDVQHRKSFCSKVPFLIEKLGELPIQSSVIIYDEISFFYCFHKNWLFKRLYNVDKLRLIGVQAPSFPKNASDFLFDLQTIFEGKQQVQEEEHEKILETARATVKNVIKQGTLEYWQVDHLHGLKLSLRKGSLPIILLHDRLLFLLFKHRAFSKWSSGMRECSEVVFLSQTISEVRAENNQSEIWLYGVLCWFHIMKTINNSSQTKTEDNADQCSFDRFVQMVLLSNPLTACCQVHHKLFSYIYAVDEWVDSPKTPQKTQILTEEMLMRLKSSILNIIRLSQFRCIHIDIVDFFFHGICHGLQKLQNSTEPMLDASIIVYTAFSAFLGLIGHTHWHFSFDDTLRSYVRLLDALVILSGTHIVATKFPFIRSPSGSMDAWFFEMCLYLGLIREDSSLKLTIHAWFCRLGQHLRV